METNSVKYCFYSDKTKWRKDMCDLVYRLKKNYNFYFSGTFITIRRSLGELIDARGKKNTHKMIMYFNDNSGEVSLVIYSRKNTTAYVLKDVYISQRSMYGLRARLLKSYQEAVNEQLQSDLSPERRPIQPKID